MTAEERARWFVYEWMKTHDLDDKGIADGIELLIRAAVKESVSILESALTLAVDECPVCGGTGLLTRIPIRTRDEPSCGPTVRTHCDYCFPMREAVRRAEAVRKGGEKP